jgi:hypothetical protein
MGVKICFHLELLFPLEWVDCFFSPFHSKLIFVVKETHLGQGISKWNSHNNWNWNSFFV